MRGLLVPERVLLLRVERDDSPWLKGYNAGGGLRRWWWCLVRKRM